MADAVVNSPSPIVNMPISEHPVEQVLVERLRQDHNLMTKLLLNRDIDKVLEEEGFNVDENFLPWVELSVKKIRTYITDQLHFMGAQIPGRVGFGFSNNNNNGAQDW
jgi:hypothetical protein